MQRLLSVVRRSSFINLSARCHQNRWGWNNKRRLQEMHILSLKQENLQEQTSDSTWRKMADIRAPQKVELEFRICRPRFCTVRQSGPESVLVSHLSCSNACWLCRPWRSSCWQAQRLALPAPGTGTDGQTTVLLCCPGHRPLPRVDRRGQGEIGSDWILLLCLLMWAPHLAGLRSRRQHKVRHLLHVKLVGDGVWKETQRHSGTRRRLRQGSGFKRGNMGRLQSAICTVLWCGISANQDLVFLSLHVH